jgi:hypothetical protein
MTLTLRSIIELIIGLCLVIAAVVIGLNTHTDAFAELLLTLLSLGGIVIMAHAIWLMRKRE